MNDLLRGLKIAKEKADEREAAGLPRFSKPWTSQYLYDPDKPKFLIARSK